MRGEELDSNSVVRTNEGLFNIYNAILEANGEEPLPESYKNENKYDSDFIFEQLRRINNSKEGFNFEIKFYSTSTVAPVYIVNQFVVKGFLLYQRQAARNPHLIFVNDIEQNRDVYDILSANFVRVWKTANPVPTKSDEIEDEVIEAEGDKIDIFVSYSSKNIEDALKIEKWIKERNLKYYKSERSLSAGVIFEKSILRHIKNAKYFLFFATPDSINSSWVLLECGAAWALGSNPIPVILRIKPEELPELLRRYHVVDMHNLTDFLDEL